MVSFLLHRYFEPRRLFKLLSDMVCLGLTLYMDMGLAANGIIANPKSSMGRVETGIEKKYILEVLKVVVGKYNG